MPSDSLPPSPTFALDASKDWKRSIKAFRSTTVVGGGVFVPEILPCCSWCFPCTGGTVTATLRNRSVSR